MQARSLEVPLDSRKPVVIAGMRRTGKSSYLNLLQQKLIKEGKVSRENICYVNFVDERLRPLRRELLTEIETAYRELYPDSKNSPVYWFFDEIHLVDDWEFFIERLARKSNNHIFITGSSATLSSSQISSALRGRPLVYEIFPFSISEVFQAKDLTISSISTQLKPKIQKTADEYIIVGGLPETLNVDQSLRYKIHSEYYRSILVRDIIERHNPRNSYSTEVILKELTSQVGLLTSFNRIKNRLSSIGTRVSINTVLDCFAWAQEAYYLYQVELYTESVQKRRVNPFKIYSIDSGLLHSTSTSLNNNMGRLFENMVYAHLRRKFSDIFYYKTNSDYEVDFIIPRMRGKKDIIQVSYDLSDSDTRYREIRALEEAMKELGSKHSFLVTQRAEESISVEGGEISILPAWRFFSR